MPDQLAYMAREFYPLLMFASLFLLLAFGVPIAFSLAAVAIVFAYFLWGAGALNLVVSAAWGSMAHLWWALCLLIRVSSKGG